jgi:hypothetical protein
LEGFPPDTLCVEGHLAQELRVIANINPQGAGTVSVLVFAGLVLELDLIYSFSALCVVIQQCIFFGSDSSSSLAGNPCLFLTLAWWPLERPPYCQASHGSTSSGTSETSWSRAVLQAKGILLERPAYSSTDKS